MNTTYRDDRGPITLGKRLGQGGQGTVYEMGSEAVKIYTGTPTADHAQKIRALLTVRTATLEAVSAWPSRLVYAGKDPVGYVMPKITNQHPVGRVSLPASRKVEFSEKPWGWLIHIARNLSAAIDQIHTAGVIVGDLNDANIYVGDNAVVRVLDVDSFQISVNGKSWNTGVGVPMYLPPELQGRDLTKIPRTQHHDAFGLAVVIFQLLMMGRHPWGGDYRSDKTIDQLIASEPFIYGQTARGRGLAPPGSAPKMEWLHTDVVRTFERAFSQTTRPSAKEWAVVLETFRTALTHCTVSKTHQFVPKQGNCPWCVLEQQNGIFYFLPSIPTHRPSSTSTFVIKKLEDELALLELPENFYKTNPKNDPVVVAAPRPTWIRSYLVRMRIVGLALVGLTIAGAATYGIGAFLIGLFLSLILYGSLAPNAMAARHKKKAENELASQQNIYDELIAQWHAAGSSLILEIYEKTKRDIAKYKSLGQLEAQEFQELHSKHRDIMIGGYLAKYLIRDANIGLPRVAVQSLEAYGVQTAADIKILDTMKVPQIGTVRSQKLRDWHTKLMSQFSYDPKAKLPNYMVNETRARYDKQRRDLETQLPQQIERIKFSINRWNDEKPAKENPIREQAQRIREQRALIAMWASIPNI
jgi:DNA-binding helix-hairpin-helix protein with protein kinase domain